MTLDTRQNSWPAGHGTNATGPPRRSDAGVMRFTGRDITCLVLAGDMYGVPYDLLGVALGARPARVRAVTRRWRQAGLARIRAVLAIRITLEAGQAFAAGPAWWRSERHIRSAAARTGVGHVPDAEVHWPDTGTCPYPGECWAIEAELTPNGMIRTTAIMTSLLTRTAGWEPGTRPGRAPRYHHVVYLRAPAALPTVQRATASPRAPWAAGSMSAISRKEPCHDRVPRPAAALALAAPVDRTYHDANHDLVVEGDPLPVHLRRSFARKTRR